MRTLILLFAILAATANAGDTPLSKGKASSALSDQVWDQLEKGKTVKPEKNGMIDIEGWIIPNEYEKGELSSFLLARFPGGCIHVPLPPASSVIEVVMGSKSKKIKSVASTAKFHVHGELKAGERVDAEHRLIAESVEEIAP
ncbi:MAG: DUF3299 domain-containing protein [Bdellovibrionota bacterium]